MGKVDEYIEKVIRQGDVGSQYLAMSSAQTLENGDLVEILEDGMNGLAVLRIPNDQVCGAVSIGGDPSLTDSREYAASVVDRAVSLMREHDFVPIGFADIIDSSTGNLEDLKAIQEVIVERVNHYGLPIMNGENAILGERVVGVANITGTIIGTCPDSREMFPDHTESPGIAVFHPKGQAIYVNCDGIGTKGEFGERAGTPEVGLGDTTAMKLDDLIKVVVG